MSYLEAVILSAVEGITEFLPISSTGHLILTAEILKIPQNNFTKSFEIIIQFGAILAVVFLYWKTILQNKIIWKNIFIAFLPTAFFGFIFYKLVKQFLIGNTLITLAAIFLGGIAIILLEILYKEKEHHVNNLGSIPLRTAFLIGIFQSIAIIPGISRSAATIIGALFLGTKRKTAVEFSFLLAIPTMFAASVLDILKSGFNFSVNELSVLAVGFLGSFIFAVIAIKFLLRFIKNHTFIPFGIYRIILAILFYLLILNK